MGISPGASIGEGLYIGHIGGVIISQQAVIGRNCDISHRVTIGTSAMGREGAPVLGDNIYVGTGSTLVGKIRIGSGAKIAANTLVIDDVPEGATMMGVPGRILFAPARSIKSRHRPSRSQPIGLERSITEDVCTQAVSVDKGVASGRQIQMLMGEVEENEINCTVPLISEYHLRLAVNP